MTHVLEDHNGSVSLDGKKITNLRFADNIDALADKEEEELFKLVNQLYKALATFLWHGDQCRKD